eukprot:m.140050 g.140050  ORF g.140050 m.140050 type:complete len:607 (+) comp14943_c0_seq3:3053-4873(+)
MGMVLWVVLVLCGLTVAQDCQNGVFLCPTNDCPTHCDDVNFRCYFVHPTSTMPTCDHKALNPVNGNDIGMFIVLFVVLALSSAAGIGGGGLIIPLMMVTASFPTYYSVPLSVTSIVGGSIVRFVIQIRQHHPVDKRRPLIDVPLVLLLLPPILIGTILGVILNSVSPTWLVLVTIFLVLSFVSYETLKKAIALRKQERKPPSLLPTSPATMQLDTITTKDPDTNDTDYASNEPRGLSVHPQRASMSSQRDSHAYESSTDGDVEETGLPSRQEQSTGDHQDQEKSPGVLSHLGGRTHWQLDDADQRNENETRGEEQGKKRVDPELQMKAERAFYSPFLDTITGAQARQLLLAGEMESRHLTPSQEASVLEGIRAAEARFPLGPVLWTFALLAFVVILSLVRGGQSGESFAGVTCGSGAWASVLVACLVVLFVVGAQTANYLRREYNLKVQVGYRFLPGDIHYTPRRTLLLPLTIVLAGFVAGYLGIGAGMIVGPFLLYLGLLPMVSTATTSYLTLFTSASATIQYISLGRVPVDYGVTLFLLSMAASLTGQYAIVKPIKRRKKIYALVFILAAIIVSATILLLVTGSLRFKQQSDDGGHMGFSPLCE